MATAAEELPCLGTLGPMDGAKQVARQIMNTRYIIGGKIFFYLIIGIHFPLIVIHGIVTSQAHPDSSALKATLDSSPFIALALFFICAARKYHNLCDHQKEIPLSRPVRLPTQEAKGRALTVLVLVVLSLFIIYVTIELPAEFWDIKVCLTTYWINLHIIFVVSEMNLTSTDEQRKINTETARGVCLVIVLAQYCYCLAKVFSLFTWAFWVFLFLAFSLISPYLDQYCDRDSKRTHPAEVFVTMLV